MYMKGSGIVWVWNLVSESKHDVKWRDVDFLFSSAVSFFNPGCEEAGFTEAFHNQNGSIFLLIISL